jgi:hypothetical protein
VFEIFVLTAWELRIARTRERFERTYKRPSVELHEPIFIETAR